MPLPKGDVHKKKEVIQDVTLHDLDIANARPQVSSILVHVVSNCSVSRKLVIEIPCDLQLAAFQLDYHN